MKKLFVTVAFAAFVGLTSFAADITKVNQRVQAAFEKEFTTATNVSWEMLKGQQIYHASFTYASEIMEAYFSEDGEFIAAVRHITPDKLPLLVSRSINQHFGQYTFKEASEYMSPETTSYIVTLENEKATVSARIYISGGFEIIKKTKKS
jgi:hypothetical protein